MRSAVFLFAALSLFLTWSTGATARAASAQVSVAEELVATLALPEDKIDLTETLLSISRHWDPNLDTAPLRKTLDQLADSARNQLKSNPSPEQTVEILRKVIHEEGRYRYTEALDPTGMPVNPAELFLHGLLQTRRGYCMNLSLLYLILAERLNLPIFGVPLPNHFFVRYDSTEYRVNIEATEGGTAFPDSFYEQRFGVTNGSKYFLTNLGKKQTLGAYFSNVGLVMYRAGKPEAAVFYLEQSAGINPQSIDALNNLGNIYSELRQHDKSIHAYERALEADPGNFSTLFNLGLAYMETNSDDKAKEVLLQAAQIDPRFYLAHEMLSRIYLRQKKFASALLHLKIMKRLQPENLRTQLDIGTVILEMGQAQLALGYFRNLQNQFPQAIDVNARMGDVYYRMKDYPKAIVQYEFVIERAPQFLENYIQLGWIHYQMGNLTRAIAVTQQGLQFSPQDNPLNTLAYMNLGLYHTLEKKFDAAEKWYQKTLDTEDPKAVDAMIDDLKGALKNYPEIPELDYFGGWILFKGGQKDQAREWFNRYLAQNPKGTLAEQAKKFLNQVASLEPRGMVLIPKGFFLMGANGHGDDEAPEHKVYLDAYYIDKYEVTAAEFAEFLNDVKMFKEFYKDSKFGMLVLEKDFRARKGLESYPINNVTWFGAAAFCKWKNKRLPSEAEWEKAARGTEGNFFPWGNDPINPQRARYRQEWTEEIAHRVMVPVDSMPEGKSPYGLFHMLGNVKEWVDDWYDREYYKEENHNLNPRGQIGGEFKVLKGGSWRDLRSFVYASFRNNSHPNTALDDYGFRCAQDGPEGSAPKRMTSLEHLFIPARLEHAAQRSSEINP
ncbi:MAG: SUMF1/EgtB/PvdO family nonheme iron enzyme [Nitrospinota bacterium]|nr:SUMF1/EgtB/PvdO family nonheme iron enzyme [Nitrospinota bacterium]